MANDRNIQRLPLEEVMGERFGRYSKYIIQDRAIPDVRDGLKPVQRRILYAMFEEGNTWDKGFRKSAKAVGNVIGNYHPHGESSVYDAIVRLSQDWKMREPLIEMQGNNGSMDGDPAAAMRYTEGRLSKVSEVLMEDLDKETVDWVNNFDDTAQEPIVFPAGYPNLLVNGATGISAGYATDIPPHNLSEVIDATIYIIQHPGAGLEKLMSFLPGPDFPTGGIVQGKEEIKQAYETGRGKIVVRSKTNIEKLRGGKEQIVITEVPYEVNKARMVQQVDAIRINREIDGITEVRDETDREGLRVIIELDKGIPAEGILTYLLKNTDLQVNYNMNMVVINNRRPEQIGIKGVLQAFITHRRDIISKRTQYDFEKARDRHHIVEGLIKAVSILEDVIDMIRKSKNKKDSKENIKKAFDFTEAQAEAIVSLQLYRLSNTDITQLENEAEELEEKMTHYQDILENEEILDKTMIAELREVKKRFGNPRRTVLEEEIEKLEVEKEVLISNEDVMVTVTNEGYVKRTSLRSYGSSEPKEVGLRDKDFPIFVRKMSTLEQIVLFTSKGNAINRPVHSLPDIRWKDVGEHVSQSLNLEEGEEIIHAFGLEEMSEDENFVFITKEGYIKQTKVSEFEPRKTYYTRLYRAINLKTSTDELVRVVHVDAANEDDVMIITKQGYGLRYPLEEVSVVGVNAAGVQSISLKEGDEVVSGIIMKHSKEEQPFMLFTQRGAMKKMDVSQLEQMARNRRGQVLLTKLKAKPHEISLIIPIDDEAQRITAVTDLGEEYTFKPSEIAINTRTSNGSFVFDEVDGQPDYYIKHFFEEEDSESI